MLESIRWFGHGSFAIDGPQRVYINPWRVPREDRPADVILISRNDYDTLSLGDIQKLRGPQTRIFGPAVAMDDVQAGEALRAWHSVCIDRVAVQAVPAYRHDLPEDALGFKLSVYLYDVFYAATPYWRPELGAVTPDILLVPLGDESGLLLQPALDLTRQLKPRWVIPYQWGGPGEVATRLEAQMFKREAEGLAEVVLLTPSLEEARR